MSDESLALLSDSVRVEVDERYKFCPERFLFGTEFLGFVDPVFDGVFFDTNTLAEVQLDIASVSGEAIFCKDNLRAREFYAVVDAVCLNGFTGNLGEAVAILSGVVKAVAFSFFCRSVCGGATKLAYAECCGDKKS